MFTAMQLHDFPPKCWFMSFNLHNGVAVLIYFHRALRLLFV